MTSKRSEKVSPSDNGRKTAAAVCIAFAFLVALLSAWLTGCNSTVIPQALPVAEQASFDGNDQNSGVIASTPAGVIVTDRFRARYNDLIAKYGRDLKSPIYEPDTDIVRIEANRWLITKQRAIDAWEMNAWRRAGLTPKNL